MSISYAVFCLKKKKRVPGDDLRRVGQVVWGGRLMAINATHYEALSGHERFQLLVEAMARKDEVECKRLEDSCQTHVFFFEESGDHQDIHSFPTRRSSDLTKTPRQP